MTFRRLFSRTAMTLILMLLTTATAWADGYDYIDADGKLKNIANDWVNNINSAPVTDPENPVNFSLENGWTIFTFNDHMYIGNLIIDGDVHLIISDVSELSIESITINSGGSLTIYCQNVNKGLITVEPSGGTAIYVGGSLTINGCNITANATGNVDYGYGNGIEVSGGSVTINGGSVTANATDAYGINVSGGSSFTVKGGSVIASSSSGAFTVNGGTVTVGSCNSDVTLVGGAITASSYYGKLTIGGGCKYTDGTSASYTGSIDEPEAGTTYQPEWTGSGLENTPYLIKTTNDLDLLAKRVNAGNDFSGKFFKLANDIWYWYNIFSLYESRENYKENYTAIGTADHPFCGTFDGANYTISSIYINKTGKTDADSYQGLFGHVGTGGTVKNVILSDAQITGFQYVGGIVGAIDGGTVENCHIIRFINDFYFVYHQNDANCFGGIAGSNLGGTVTCCTSQFNYDFNVNITTRNHGGIVGSNSGTVSDCLSLSGCLPGSYSVGTIVGYNTGTVSNSYFPFNDLHCRDKDGNAISGDNGAVGFNDGGTVTDCRIAPQDTKDNSAFLSLMAQRTDALTAVTRPRPLDTGVGVSLNGRTLYKDGKWNTICLPFALSAEQIAAHTDFSGATLMELDTDGKNGFDPTDGTLWLTFKSATAIAAGVPYLVKWSADGDDFTSPTFSGVTIDATASTTVSDADDELQEVQMVGCYSPVPVEADDKSILFLGDANTLYYSNVDRDIRSFRAYFSVPYIKEHAGVKARAFRLDFGEGETNGITATDFTDYTEKAGAWHKLDGRRLAGKPTAKGIYVSNGRKIVIK